VDSEAKATRAPFIILFDMMKQGLLVLVLVALAFASSQQAFQFKLQRRMFQQFMSDHSKVYSNSDELEHRFTNYQKNLERIKEMNEKSPMAKFAVNKFADLSPEEFADRVLMEPVSGRTLSQSCLGAGALAEPSKLKRQELPKHWDWRDKGVVTRVRDQGLCGSCWTFSTTGCIEAQWALKGNKLVEFSQQQLVDCSDACTNITGEIVCNSGCNGGFQWNAFTDIMAWGGLQPAEEYPYTQLEGVCSMNKKRVLAPVKNYTCLSTPDIIGADEDEMAAYLYTHGPLAIAIDADYLQGYSTGIVDPWLGMCDPTGLNHAVLLVGYGEEESQFWGVKKYWIVKNSWGPNWGEAGYFRIVRGKGACGLNLAVSSPILA